MRVLILEDNEQRQRAFLRSLQGCHVVITDDALVAINQLRYKRWDALFLDHDLNGEAFVPSGPGTGYEVAVWLARHPHKIPRQVFVHSANASGAENIMRVLPGAIRAEGCWNDIRVVQ